MRTTIPGGRGSSSPRYQLSAPRARYLSMLSSCAEWEEGRPSCGVKRAQLLQAACAMRRAGVSLPKGPSPSSPSSSSSFNHWRDGRVEGRCEWRCCPKAGHMPTGLGLSLLQESAAPNTPLPQQNPAFSPQPPPSIQAARPTSLPLPTLSAGLSIIRSGARKRSPYEPGQ